ncbi:MAG TPA: baseplate J/gp47 family protein [Gaiellaceae bacterium]|nr:baseplate J/gp47 family protein [Gaiellaceae bacterium]
MSVTPAYDRLQTLLGDNPPPTFNGIDYVEIASADATQLRVHFLNTVVVQGSLDPTLPVAICGGETIGFVPVLPIDETTAWSSDDEGRWILALSVAAPGDFSLYTLTIRSTQLDPYFDSARFTFRIGCDSDFDCRVPEPPCEPPDEPQVPIDYLAKDFTSFKQALSDFSHLRYPLWVERSEADVGVMLMEVLSAVADELSYLQDRVAAEATLATATQRVSLVRQARLVDYEPSPALAATTLLQFDVADGVASIDSGLRCSALGPNGLRVPFEVGEQLADHDTGEPVTQTYPVDHRWNAGLSPYWWDTSRECLTAGSTRFWLIGTGLGLFGGQTLLIDTAGPTSADPPVRELVTVAAVKEVEDPVPAPPVPLTRVDLVAPTTLDHDLEKTTFAGNLLPAQQGGRASETFAIPDPSVAPPPPGVERPLPVVVRTAANWTCDDPRPDYRFTLAASQISWTPIPDAEPDLNTSAPSRPQISLTSANALGTPDPWMWERWLLDASEPDAVFALTDERYSAVGGVDGATWFEYDGEGVTIRFGDGVFGRTPLPGTVFTVTYLAGGGVAGNVPAGTIVQVDPGQPAAAHVLSVTNPFAATGGADEETTQQIRDRAPQAFRAKPLRVVRTSDYVAAAESLPWVLQAGTSFRWTGSWLTVFTTADPHDREDLTITELEGLNDLLDRRRLAGYESYVLPPVYASFDLKITLCAQPDAFAGDVEKAVLTRLRPGLLANGTRGFFDHERWRFGEPLEASALLAAVQSATGVQGVTAVCYRERGVQTAWSPLPETVTIPPDRVLRVDDDPSLPERGSLRVIVDGGK